MKILVTGGLGFVGLHTVKALCAAGHQVRIFDSLDQQAHPLGVRPQIQGDVLLGDIRSDRDTLLEAIDGSEAIYHLAARVGVGQSMYDFREYFDVNTQGTAHLLDCLLKLRWRGRLIVASSMSIYGEGLAFGGVNETALLRPSSFYAQSKRHQEEICLLYGKTYGNPVVALRYFNIYGPGQTLSNPYTGVVAIFASRLLNGEAPIVFGDGSQSRDFVHVSDIVQANLLALEQGDGMAINVGTGRPTSVAALADLLCEVLHSPLRPEITKKERAGDVKHCWADITRARLLLGYEPHVSLQAGLAGMVGWLRKQQAVDHLPAAITELLAHKLIQ